MYLILLGGIVIFCCLVYIFAVEHPDYFVGNTGKKKELRKWQAETRRDEPKVIYLPQSPDDLEAEKARRSRKKK
mgnify:CR=1 FL=1